VDEAIIKVENFLGTTPNDSEAIAILGKIYKEMWIESWKWVENKDKRLRTAFDSYHWLMKAIDTYMKGFRVDLNQIYPGVNALTLSTMLVELAAKYEDPESPDPEIIWVRNNLDELRGALIFAIEAYIDTERADYWTLVSMAELRVLTAKNIQEVTRAYRKALTASRRNTFFLQSSLSQLEMLRSLEMRSEFVEAGIHVIKDEMRRMRKEEESEEEHEKAGKGKLENRVRRDGYVFLFTGYMIDNPKKKNSNFPPEKENDIRKAIDAILNKYNAGPDDLAVTTGMDAGSEIIFVESCVEHNVPVQAYFPTPEAPYVRDFVSPGGERWVERFYRMRNHPMVDEFYQPDRVGLPKEGDNVNERNNRWALYSALTRGIDKARLIALWDGKNEQSKDLDTRLIKHMVDLMRDTGGIVEQINPEKLNIKVDDETAPAPAQTKTNKAVKKTPAKKPKRKK
jgi:hypothetical protein